MQIGSDRIGKGPWDGTDPRDIPTVELRRILAASTNASSPYTAAEAEAVKIELARRSDPDAPLTLADIARRGHVDADGVVRTGIDAVVATGIAPNSGVYPNSGVAGASAYPNTAGQIQEKEKALADAKIAGVGLEPLPPNTPAPVYPATETVAEAEARAKAKAAADAANAVKP